MFAVTGQVERAFQGREAFQEIDQVGTLGGARKMGRRTESRRGRRRRRGRGRSTGARSAGPGRSSSRSPRICSTSRRPTTLQIEAARSTVARPSDEEIRAVIELLDQRPPARDPRRRRCAPGAGRPPS